MCIEREHDVHDYVQKLVWICANMKTITQGWVNCIVCVYFKLDTLYC